MLRFRLKAHTLAQSRPDFRPIDPAPAKPNKRKQIQIKPRKKAWISLDSFGRIGTFQWVTVNPNKKILPADSLPEESRAGAGFISDNLHRVA
jgi:hypothetical protein